MVSPSILILTVRSLLSRMELGDLCEVYEDPDSGVNTCRQLVEDSRCVGKGKSIDLLDIVSAALDILHEHHEGSKEIVCQCACWSEIAQVFSKMSSVVRTHFSPLCDDCRLNTLFEQPFFKGW